jgi:NADH dehydrogenase (ubiquinone) Fe-S protein 4
MASLQRAALRVSAARPALSRRTPALARGYAAETTAARAAEGEAKRPASDPSEAPGFKPGQASTWGLQRQEGAVEGQPRHKPDYEVLADYRTSYGGH